MPERTNDRVTTSPRPRSPRVILGLFAGAAAFMVLTSIGLSQMVGRPEGAEHSIVIPAGTAQRLAAGEDVELIPTELRYRLRDQLIVINQDVVGHQVGPFIVAPGERLEQRFSEVATLQGFCSLHAAGSITIDIGSS